MSGSQTITLLIVQVWSALESGCWQPRDASIALTAALKRNLGPQTAGQPHEAAAKDEAWRLFEALQRAGLVSCTTTHHDSLRCPNWSLAEEVSCQVSTQR